MVSWEEKWYDWRTRHAIHAASEGGIFPDVVIRRVRDAVELSWGYVRGAGIPDHVKFAATEPDYVRLKPKEVAEPLYEVLLGAAEHLGNRAPSSTRIKRLICATRELKLGDAQRQDSMMM